MRLLIIASALSLAAATPASAQPGTGNPAGMSPGTVQAAPGMPSSNQPNQADRLFVQEATIGGAAEVDLGRLAEQKGQSQAVKEFGRQMVADHGKANQQLNGLAQAARVAQPQQLDEEHKAMFGQLERSSGAGFDLAYIRGQVTDHQKTAQLLEWEIGSGQDPQLKTFASQVLPIVLQHLEMASTIEDEMTGAAPRPPISGTSVPQTTGRPLPR